MKSYHNLHGWIRFSAEKPVRGDYSPPDCHSTPLLVRPPDIIKRDTTKVVSLFMVEEGGFEPPKLQATDLQSAPFGHSGTLPYYIKKNGAGDGTRTRDLLITNQLLYQLSYASTYLHLKWSGLRDLNPRPLGPKPSALPNCAKPRQSFVSVALHNNSIFLAPLQLKKVCIYARFFKLY